MWEGQAAIMLRDFSVFVHLQERKSVLHNCFFAAPEIARIKRARAAFSFSFLSPSAHTLPQSTRISFFFVRSAHHPPRER